MPRPLLRLFWALHRAIYRATDGRLGLQRPVTGQKFGMMRLTTIGRRSGRTRLAIVGYYEDGPNLVTLAMNGWAKPHGRLQIRHLWLVPGLAVAYFASGEAAPAA